MDGAARHLPQDFALNHPAGSLGKQLTLTAKDLMVPVAEVISHLTADGVGACWVKNTEQPVRIWGLIADGDLRRVLQQHGPDQWNALTAGDLMTKDSITIQGSTLAIEALKQMERNRRKAIAVLPMVSEHQSMQGLLRLTDLAQAGLTTS